jgi:hypothetical protein
MLAFPTIITLHTICMGFLAGASSAIDLRILGATPGIPLSSLEDQSSRHMRTLTHLAVRCLSANQIACALTSMMARSTKRSNQRCYGAAATTCASFVA